MLPFSQINSCILQVEIIDNVHDKRVSQTSECRKNPSPYIITIRSDNSQPLGMSEPNNEGRILLALKALQNSPKLSARRAAEMYHVHSRTLQRRRRGVQARRDIVPNSR